VVLCLAAGLGGYAQTSGSETEPAALPPGAWARLGVPRLEFIDGAALSPDGKLLAFSNNRGWAITIIERATGKRVAYLRGQLGDADTQVAAFSADGKVLVGHNYQGLRLWEVASGKLLRSLRYQEMNFGNANTVTVSADASVVAVATSLWNQQGQKNSVTVWSGAKSVRAIDVMHNSEVGAVLSADGKLLATSGRQQPNQPEADSESNRTVQLWDVASGKELRKLVLDGAIRGMTFAPSGKLLAIASGAATFHIHDPHTGIELRRFAGRRLDADARPLLAFAPDEQTLLANTADGSVQAWNVATGQRRELAEGPPGRVVSVAFPRPDQILVLGLNDQTPYWWEAISGKVLSPLGGHERPVEFITYTPGGGKIISASGDGKLIWWDAGTGKELRQESLAESPAPWSGVRRLDLSANTFAVTASGQHVAMGDYGGARLYDLPRRRLLCEFDASNDQATVAFSPSGARLAVAGADGRTTIWDVAGGQALGTLGKSDVKTFDAVPTRLAFAQDGNVLCVHRRRYDAAARRNAGELVVWDVAAKVERARVKRDTGWEDATPALAVVPDGRFFALGESAGFTLWSASGKELRRIRADTPPTALAFAPDGRTLVASFTTELLTPTRSSLQTTLDFYETATGQLRQRFNGHTSRVHWLAFSPDGAVLAAGSTDTTITLWDVGGRKQPPPAQPVAADLERAWDELHKPDAKLAQQAIQRLGAAPAAAVALLGSKLRPVEPPSAAQLAAISKHIANLDNQNFAVRDAASRELAQLGEGTLPALRKAMAGTASLERHRRLEELLAKLQPAERTPDELRQARALEVLERLASPAAEQLLSQLAGGAPAARLTQDAAATLCRLESRKVSRDEP
jgi:WD40 repeat protein